MKKDKGTRSISCEKGRPQGAGKRCKDVVSGSLPMSNMAWFSQSGGSAAKLAIVSAEGNMNSAAVILTVAFI
ncbi:MAG: hypothetical protein HQ580_06570 [Planctomycetes bacterium]|nr:hypothetical protein [Planctomycetota bacterium]